MNGGRRPPAIWLKILIKPKIFESRKTDTKHLTKRARCGILYTVRGTRKCLSRIEREGEAPRNKGSTLYS